MRYKVDKIKRAIRKHGWREKNLVMNKRGERENELLRSGGKSEVDEEWRKP